MTKRINEMWAVLKANTTYQYLLLCIIIVLAAALRFYKLGQWSFWIEEYHSLRHTAELDSLQKILSSIRPLFYLLVRPVFAALGVSEWSARLVPALVGILTIPVLFWLTKRLFGLSVALLTTVLLAVSPWHLYWSQNARFYTLLLLFFTLSLFAFYWGIETDRFRYIVVSLITLALGGATHGLAILLVPVFLLYFLALKVLPFAKPPGLRLRNLLPFFLLPLAGYVVYDVYRIFMAGIDPLFSVLYRQFFDQSTASFVGYSAPYVMLTAVVYYIGTPLAFLTVPGSYCLLKQKSRSGLLLIIGATFPLSLMMLLTLFASTANRYVFMTLPCWIILGALAVKELLARARRDRRVFLWSLGIPILLVQDPVVEDVLYYGDVKAQVVFFLALGLLIYILGLLWISLARAARQRSLLVWGFSTLFLLLWHPLLANDLYFFYQHGHRDNWIAAASAIRARRVNGDEIVSSIPTVASYYLDGDVVDIKNVDLDEILHHGKRVWFVEDYGIDLVQGGVFERWAGANCDFIDAWDEYTAGRNWKMRLYLCHAAEAGRAESSN